MDLSLSTARRSRLLGIKLRALVGEHLGEGAALGESQQFAPGAALLHGDHGWVYLDDRPAERLGAALAWALRTAVGHLHVIAESGTGQLARRAAEFAFPISIWHADGRTLWAALAEPLLPPSSIPDHHGRFRDLITAAGATPVEEHGVLVGEVAGLEVCRVVDDPTTGVTRLAVGVGAHDREAFAMLHGDEPASEALARVVDVVGRHRRPDAAPHPLNRLGAERLLRWRVLEDPAVIGARRLEAAPPPVPRANLKESVPCVAVGEALDGGPVTVVFSTGVDLDLIPYAADARLATGGHHRLLVLTRRRDRLPVVEQIAGLLREPAALVSVDVALPD